MSQPFTADNSSDRRNVSDLLFAARRHLQQNELADAARCYEAVLHQQPDCFEALAQLGALRLQAGNLPEAAGLLEAARRRQPKFPNLNLMLGSAYQRQGRFEEAAQCCRRETAVAPQNADAHYNLGLVLQKLERSDEAGAAYGRALELRPGYVDALVNLGNLRWQSGRVEAALPLLEAAVRLAPQNAEAHWEWGMALLVSGDFQRGWAEYKWRWQLKDFAVHLPPLSRPRWTGEALQGRRILLQAEQGFGDAIQFVRYAPLVAARGGRVVIGCPEPLRRLFETVAGVERVVSQFAELPEYDVQAPLMALPEIFQTSLNTVPAAVPYFSLPKIAAAEAPAGPVRRRVGLVWAGQPAHRHDRYRSLPLEVLEPLLNDRETEWISLQVGGSNPRLDRLVAEGRITNWGAGLRDFMDTALAIMQLDLVIAVDTSVAHLAGALGRPVWLLLSFHGEWRWLLARSDSPWYPTMRLFRQSRPGDWPGVIERVAAAWADFKRHAVSP
jgi:tetratricopeptide (TPR) repeat protein